MELFEPVDAIICCLDSLNHLESFDDVKKTFKKVRSSLSQNGLFIFDVNTIYKHKNVLANNTFVYDMDSIFCVWQNTLEDNNRVQIDLDFFERCGTLYRRDSESFYENAYEIAKLLKALKEEELEVKDIFNYMTFNEVEDNSEKVVVVAQKM